MRLAAIAFSLLFATAANAQSASKTAASGMPIRLFYVYATNPDCTSQGTPVVRLTQNAEHGRVSIVHNTVFPVFPESNVRSACNRRRVPGVTINYVSQRGYTGTDQAAFEVFYPSGVSRTYSYFITVR